MSPLCYKNLEPCPYGEITPDFSRAFMMMPFRDDLTQFYREVIESTLATLGYHSSRADDRFDVPDALCKICKMIQESGILIADMTGKNENVFCEIGMCFGRGRRVILLCQSNSDNPFDTKTIDHIQYNPENPEEFIKRFRSVVTQAKNDEKIYPNYKTSYDKNHFASMFDSKFDTKNPEGFQELLETEFQKLIPVILEIIESSDETNLNKILQSLSQLIRRIRSIHNSNSIQNIPQFIYFVIIGISMRCIYHKRWNLLKTLLNHKTWNESQQRHDPICVFPTYSSSHSLNFKTTERQCLNYYKENCDKWQYSDQNEVTTLFIQSNFLINFYYWVKNSPKRPIAFFLLYNSTRIAEILSSILVSNETSLLSALFSIDMVDTLKVKLIHFITDEEPRDHLPNDFVNFDITDLSRELQKKISAIQMSS